VHTGKRFATRYSLLEGDTNHLRAQCSVKLGRETAQKYNGVALYVPEPAQRAVLNKPRRLGDDLMFRTKRGRQFRQESLHRAWTPVRAAFMAQLPAGDPCISALPSTMRTEGLLRAAAVRRQLHAQRPGARAMGDR
jgi:hypothetical protein